MIILEGFDNSGKSTLASAIEWPKYHPGPRPTSLKAEIGCITDQILMVRSECNVVYDRVTCISQLAYNPNPSYMAFRTVVAEYMANHATLIYCRPPIEVITDFSRHEIKTYDDEQWIEYVQENADVIVKRYDSIMRKLNHIVYDWTKPSQQVLDLINKANKGSL